MHKHSIKWLWDRIGGLSNPSKMPWWAWGISAWDCITGSKLHTAEGTICEGCYSLKGRNLFPAVQKAQKRRLRKYRQLGSELWVSYMTELLRRKAERAPHEFSWFRWFDSGDLQSAVMFHDICVVARCTPQIRHWLPTRESRILLDGFRAGVRPPQNMTVRWSNTRVDEWKPISAELAHYGVVASMVHRSSDVIPEHGYECPAKKHGGTCDHPTDPYLNCRACWGRGTALVSYEWH